MTARANMLLQSLWVQLRPPLASTTQNQTMPKPLMSIQTDITSTSDPKDVQFFQKHLQNVKNLNLNLLMSLGQVMFSMNSKQSEGADQPALTAPGASQPSNKGKEGLLPNPNPVASSSGRNGPMGKSLLGNGADGNSFTQTLPSALASGLLKSSSHEAGAKASLLGEPPSRLQGMGLKDYGNMLGTRLSKSVFSQLKGVGGDAGFWSGNGVNFDDSGYVVSVNHVMRTLQLVDRLMIRILNWWEMQKQALLEFPSVMFCFPSRAQKRPINNFFLKLHTNRDKVVTFKFYLYYFS